MNVLLIIFALNGFGAPVGQYVTTARMYNMAACEQAVAALARQNWRAICVEDREPRGGVFK